MFVIYKELCLLVYFKIELEKCNTKSLQKCSLKFIFIVEI